MRLKIGNNFPNNTTGDHSEIIEAPTLKEAKVSAAMSLYSNYTPYYEEEVFVALAEWLQTESDNFQLACGSPDTFTFYIEPVGKAGKIRLMDKPWSAYVVDLDIPENWIDCSYGNDALPSFTASGYHIWVDSYDEDERKANSIDICGLSDKLAPRFHVALCYGHDDFAFTSDDFDAVIKWIDDNPKTPEQIEETKEYI